jgi:hypothetical protein
MQEGRVHRTSHGAWRLLGRFRMDAEHRASSGDSGRLQKREGAESKVGAACGGSDQAGRSVRGNSRRCPPAEARGAKPDPVAGCRLERSTSRIEASTRSRLRDSLRSVAWRGSCTALLAAPDARAGAGPREPPGRAADEFDRSRGTRSRPSRRDLAHELGWRSAIQPSIEESRGFSDIDGVEQPPRRLRTREAGQSQRDRRLAPAKLRPRHRCRSEALSHQTP